jgi:hypothetical protein
MDNLDAIAAGYHALLLDTSIGGVCHLANIRVIRTAIGDFEYVKDGLKTSGSATGIASMVTLLTQKSVVPTKQQVIDALPSLPKGTPNRRHQQEVLSRMRRLLSAQLLKPEMELLFTAVIAASREN